MRSSSQILLLTTAAAACLLSCTVSAQPRNIEDSHGFAMSIKASEYGGTPLDVEFHTAPSAADDYAAATAMKPIVFRLGNAINFKLFQRVLPGHYSPPDCRNTDDSALATLPDNCHDHCQNFGRYCNYHFQNGHRSNPALSHMLGSHLVEEGARRMCVYNEYGAQEYFRYMDAMHGTGCDTQLTQPCLEQVFFSLGLDLVAVSRCIGPMDPDYKYENAVLEANMEDGQGVDHNLPTIVANQRKAHLDWSGTANVDIADTNTALSLVCQQFPQGGEHKRPLICDFCLHFCGERNHRHPDAEKCLWQLMCNDKHHTHFNTFLEHIGQEPELMPDGSEMQHHQQGANGGAHHPPQNPANGTPQQNPDQQEQPEEQPQPALPQGGEQHQEQPQEPTPPDSNMAEQQEQDTENSEFGTEGMARPGDAYPTTTAEMQAANNNNSSDDVESGWTLAMSTIFIALAASAFAMVAMVTFRNYRSKMIIDQYLREQAEKQTSNAFTSHLDPAMFPEEGELDLDVEPALQYSDHINPKAPTQPPSTSSFVLPQIS